MAFSNKAQLAMLAGRVPETLDWGRRAVELARSIGDRDVESHALNNIGTALLFGSDPLEGIARLHQSLDIALADDLHEHAARAYTNLGAGQVRNRGARRRRPGPARRDRLLLRPRPRRLAPVHARVAGESRCSSRAGMRQRRSSPGR